jgi:hypothetical protein
MDSSLSSALDEALVQAIERETFELDPVVSRLNSVQSKSKKRRNSQQ